MPNQPQDFDPYKGASMNWSQADISKQDTPDTSVNQDDAAYIENDPLFGVDISGWEGSGYTDEEIAQNNADLGDFPG
jgi:hypothetical protein